MLILGACRSLKHLGSHPDFRSIDKDVSHESFFFPLLSICCMFPVTVFCIDIRIHRYIPYTISSTILFYSYPISVYLSILCCYVQIEYVQSISICGCFIFKIKSSGGATSAYATTGELFAGGTFIWKG